MSTAPCLLLSWLLLYLQATGITEACNRCPRLERVPQGYNSVTYTESDYVLDNPDRGVYYHLETFASQFEPVTVSQLDNYRASEETTLALRLYVLDGLADSALPASLLTSIQADLQIFRQAGWTVLIRFAYTIQYVSSAPYGDATKARMLQHIGQLQPVWTNFAGIITTIQAGFIGIWGEWYYTTHFGDPQHPDSSAPYWLALVHWQNRQDVLEAILNASPQSVAVQIRTPFSKMQMFGSSPTTLAEVTSGSTRGRTGHHNDCFLADDTDMGTYSEMTPEKAFLERDTRYLPIGGETCARATPDAQGTRRSDCPTAMAEMRRFHWSYINHLYHPDVTGDWHTQGCYDDIKKHIGYRLYLKQAILPTSVSAGKKLCFRITLANSGYAAPFKDWAVSLVLKAGSTAFSAPVPSVDVRTWLPGSDHVISGSVQIPSSMPQGTYDLYLTLVKSNMADHSDSYVLLANSGLTDPSSGLNPLHAAVQVSGRDCSTTTCPFLASWTPPARSRYPRVHGSQAQPCSPISVGNPSFETSDGLWENYLGGYSFSTSSPQDGNRCIQISNGGASQVFHFSPPVEKLILTGYSRHTGQSHASTPDYSLYCDITTPSGSNVWGENTPFTAGNNAWHKVQVNMNIPQGISKATCYLLYRNLQSLGGEAYFDNVHAWLLPASVSFSECQT